MKLLAALRAKAYIYLTNNNNEDIKEKSTSKCVVKKSLKLKIIKTV